MKKFIGLVFALLFATTAIAQEESGKVKQEVQSGSLEQTVVVGESIEPIVIQYTNLKSHKSQFIEALGLTESWQDSEQKCTISGKIDRDLEAPANITTRILLVSTTDDSSYTEIKFNLLPRETAFKVIQGNVNQSLKAGEAISPIVIEYDNIKKFIKPVFPNGIKFESNSEAHTVTISGTIDESVETGEYSYKVKAVTETDDTLDVSGTFSVQGLPQTTTIKVIENASQKLVAGDSIKPIVFEYTNMVEPTLETNLPGGYSMSNDKSNHKLTVFGLVNENTKDGSYTIQVTAMGTSNYERAIATVEVTHKPAVTKIELISDNATQTVNAGDSIKPLVFKFENAISIIPRSVTDLSCSLVINQEEKTATLIGMFNKNAKGNRTITVDANGLDNNATASATVVVNPLPLEFKLVEGNDKQTVVAGDSIIPIVYHYERLASIKVGGFPKEVHSELIKEENLFKIFGAVASDAEIKEYTYTLELLDQESNTTTVTGTINVVAPQQSSSSISSSSSSVASSSATSSSSIQNDKSSSSVISSSSAISSSSITASSSSIKQSSSSAKSSSSVKSSSSKEKSSSSVKSSSSGKSSDAKSSDSKTDLHTIAAMQNFRFGFANNKLTVAQPISSMVRVQVFDLMGHLVESLVEPVNGSKSFSFAHLNKGNYVIRIESSQAIRTAKVVVK